MPLGTNSLPSAVLHAPWANRMTSVDPPFFDSRYFALDTTVGMRRPPEDDCSGWVIVPGLAVGLHLLGGADVPPGLGRVALLVLRLHLVELVQDLGAVQADALARPG